MESVTHYLIFIIDIEENAKVDDAEQNPDDQNNAQG